MADNNQFGLPNNSTSNNESPALPITFSDPFNPSENNTSAPIGSPSTDLIDTDNLSGGSLSEELTTTQPPKKLLTGQDSSDIDVDVLTGISSDAPLVNPVGNGDDPLTDGGITLIPLGANMRQFGSSAAPTTGNQISAVNGTIDTGSLTTEDADNPTRSGRFKDDYELTNVTVGKPVTLELTSPDFDAYLQLINTNTGSVIKFDDYGSNGNNSRMLFTPELGISYAVRVTSNYGSETGTYSLKARELKAISATGESDAYSFSTTDLENPNDSIGFSYEYQLTNVTVGKAVTLKLAASFDGYLQLINQNTQQVINLNNYNPSQLTFIPVENLNYIVRVISSTEGSGDESYTFSATQTPEIVFDNSNKFESTGKLNSPIVEQPTHNTVKLSSDFILADFTPNQPIQLATGHQDKNVYLQILDAETRESISSSDSSNSNLILKTFIPEGGKKYLIKVDTYNESTEVDYKFSVTKLPEISLGSNKLGELASLPLSGLSTSNNYISEYIIKAPTSGNVAKISLESSEINNLTLELINVRTQASISSQRYGDDLEINFVTPDNSDYIVRVKRNIGDENTAAIDYTLKVDNLDSVSVNGQAYDGKIELSDADSANQATERQDDIKLTGLTAGKPVKISLNTLNSNLRFEIINVQEKSTQYASEIFGTTSNSVRSFIPQADTNYIIRVIGPKSETSTDYKIIASDVIIPSISAAGETTEAKQLTVDDVKVSYYSTYSDYYKLTNIEVGKPIKISLSSTNFITSVSLINADTQQEIRQASGSEENKNSQLTYVLQPNVNYWIKVTSNDYGSNSTGSYELTTALLGIEELFIANNPTELVDFTQDDELTTADAQISDYGSYIKDYQLKNPIVGKPVSIKLVSASFDAYLEVLDVNTQKVIYGNDDSGGNSLNQSQPRDAHLIFTPQSGKNYVIRVRGYSSGTGNYSLSAQSLTQVDANGQILSNQFLGSSSDVYYPETNYLFADSYELTNYGDGKSVSIKLNSAQFDARLEIVDAYTGEVVYRDSNSGTPNSNQSEYTNAHYIFTPEASKKYIIRVTSDNNQGTGSYELTTAKVETLTTGSIIPGILDINSDVYRFQYIGNLSDSYRLGGFSGGEIISINLSSPNNPDEEEFSTWLEVIDANTQEVVKSTSESSGFINSDILFVANSGKNYIIRVNSNGVNKGGTYRLQTQKINTIAAGSTLENLSIVTSDIKHPTKEGSYSDDFELTNLTVGKSATIKVYDTAFKPHIQILKVDEQGNVANEYSNFNDSREFIQYTFNPEASKRYIVRVSNNSSELTGAYKLKLVTAADNLEKISAINGTKISSLSIKDLGYPDSYYYNKLIQEFDLDLTNLISNRVVNLRLSAEFDAYLEVLDAETKEVIYSDDNLGAYKNSTTDSYIAFVPDFNKKYIVRVTSASPGSTGNFTLASSELSTISALNGQKNGSLDDTDLYYLGSPLYLVDRFQLIDFAPGQLVTINLTSDKFNTYLETINLDGQQEIRENTNDDVPGTTNSKISFLTEAGKTYIVRVTSSPPFASGAYTLKANIPGSVDLEVISANAPLFVTLDQEFKVDWTVKNSGTIPTWATNSQDYIYLSTDDKFDAEDVYINYLDTASKTPIAGNASYSGEKFIKLSRFPTVQNITELDNLYLLIIADANRQQPENNENNNVLARKVSLKAPDLTVKSVTPSTTANGYYFGENIKLDWVLENNGTAPITGIYHDRIWLSQDNSFSYRSDILLETITRTNAVSINPNGNSLQSLIFNLPLQNNLEAGNYYIFVETNFDGSVNEFTIANNRNFSIPINISFKPQQQLADLTVTDVSVSPSVIPGENISVTWKINNIGDVAATGTWDEEVYLVPKGDVAVDGSINFTNSTRIRYASRTATIAAKQGLAAITEQIQIPGYISDGEYWVVVTTDAGYPNDKVVEYDNQINNRSISTQTIRVGRVDLTSTITSLNPTAISGETTKLRWTVTNNGTVGISRQLVDRIYLLDTATPTGSDFTSSNAIGEIRKSRTLTANGSYTEEFDIPIPINFKDRKYIFVVTDADNQLPEANNQNNAENNNIISQAIDIQLGQYADLAVSNVSLSSYEIFRNQVPAPATVRVNWTVTNTTNGTGAGKATKWYDRVIASLDNEIGNSDDRILGVFLRDGALAPEASYDKSELIELSSDFFGRYKLFVETDADVRDILGQTIYSVFENGLEANNKAQAPNLFDVAKKPYANLTVNGVSAESTSTQTGKLLKLDWTVANIGIAATDSASWYDKVQIARRNQNGELVIVRDLEYFERTGSLSKEQGKNTYTRSRDVFIPYDLDEGTYYLVVTTGDNDNPYEFIYTNDNTGISGAIEITKGFTPDLFVSRVTTVPSALAGTKIDVTWQVFNSNLPNIGDAGGRWSDRLYLRNISTGEERNLGTFEQESGLEPGKFYSRTEQITLDPYISGTFEIFAETNIPVGRYGERALYEESSAIANNFGKSTTNLTVTLPTRPDLRVTKINVPTTSVQAGGTASASFEITNVSPVEAKGRWRDNVYLSLDGTIDGGDILIASFDNDSALTGGGKYSYIIPNFEIPKYFRDRANIIVQTDAGSTIDEFPQDDNNILVQSFAINSLPPADLVTSNVVGPNQAFAGSTVKVRYKVTNRGSGETDRDSWRDSIWLTRTQGRPSLENNERGAQDILLGDFTHSGVLQIKNDFNGSNFYEKEVEVRLPDVLEGGQWYLTAWSDAYNDVFETNRTDNSNTTDENETTLESNNYSSSFIEVLLPASPDLRVTSVTTTTPNAIGGQLFNVNWKVENKGNAAITSGSWYDEVYLADAPTLEAATEKWSLGYFERSEQLAAFTGSYEGRLETILSPGAKGKYIIVKTNAGNTVWEGPYSNNNASNIGANVTSTPADFVVTNVKTFTPNYSGDQTLIEWTVQNQGAVVWSGTRYWQDEVWVSRDSVFNASTATWLGAFTQNLPENGFSNGQTYTQRQFVTLPAGIKDDYYIHVFSNKSVIDAFESGGLPSPGGESNFWSRLDYEISVFENTDNNYNSAKLPVILREADLAISNLTIETPQPGVTPKSGDTIEVGWRVTNTGTRSTRENIWKDRVYLSVGKNDNSLDESDIFLGEYTHRGILGVGDSYTRKQEFILPDGISGDFKVIVFTDSNYVIDESGRRNLQFEYSVDQKYARVPEFDKEDNNKEFADLRIDLATPPDLQVTSLTTDQVGIAGQKFNLKYTVTNTGATTPERQSTWKDLVYLSRDNKLDLLADRFLLEIQRNTGLNAGQSYSIDQNIDLPIDVDGSYYVFVVTDPKQSNPRGTVFEGINENNNDKHSSSPLIIQLPPPVDLQVENVIIPSSTKPGENITVKWTVKNNSNNSISGGWTDAVYLSADDKWDINDRLLERRNFSGFLAANNSIDGQPNSYDLTLDNILLPGVTPGDYRIIVRTDIFNEVYEGVSGGETNNTRTSPDTFRIDAESLQLNVDKSTTLSKKQERLFKLNVQAGQTIRIKTDANDGSANEIYVGFNEAPTSTKYVTTSRGVIRPDQSAIISDTLQGTYYVLVRGIEGSDSPVTLISEALPFGITDVATDRGGDSRYVTTTIKGAQFQRGATVKLVRPGIGEFNPVRWEVVDSTTLKAIFDLSNAPHGLYDVKVTNPNGETSIVPYRYLVERAIETDVTVGLGGPNILSPGSVGNYAVSVQSLTNIDTPYVHFSFGIPELGSNPILELPYVKFSSNLAGQPDRNPDGKLNDVPWAELVSNINRSGQILAPGYVLDLPNAGFTGANFTVEVYPGLQELLKKDPTLLEGIGGEDLAFKFNIVATATAMTRDEFVAEQRREALLLRQAILQDKTATNALKNLAADSNVWANAFLAALEQAGLLRPESSAPPIRENPQVISLMATLATGLLVGPAGQEIRSTGNIVTFFENIRKWYGHDASKIGSNSVPNLEQFNKGLSRKTHSQGFNIYVPFKDARVDLPQGVDVPPPAFGSALTTPSSSSELVSLTGPLGYGNDNTIPTGVDLPYTIRFENPAIAPTSVSKVQLVSRLDSDLDPRTFQLGGLRLGDIQVNIPPGRSSFQGDFDFTAAKGFILRVSAGIDLATNTASWLLEAIDPNTGEVIQNPNIGILRPNDINGVGSGFATYTIAPKESVTGTAITSQAKIIFNNSAPIDTNRITNIIDGVAPTAFVNATKITANDYRVVWNATDDNGGSGIKHVTVYVAENGGDFKIWKSQTQDKEGVFNGKAGSTYEFLALATDNSGNKQAPTLGVTTPNDGFAVNLGTIPTVTQTTQPQILPPSSPTQQISTNQLFIQTKAENNTPSVLPTNNKPEFTSVLRPFTLDFGQKELVRE